MTADLEPARGVAVVPGTGERPRVRLSGPGALAACLPQLIGFPPVESLVLVGLITQPSGRHEIGLTLRVDLADVIRALDHRVDEEDALWERACLDPTDDDVEEQLRALRVERSRLPCHPEAMAAVLVRNGCTAAQIVAVSESAETPHADPELDDDEDVAGRPAFETYLTLQTTGIQVVDAMLVHDGRWWSYLCRNPDCCPVEGTPVETADADLLRAERQWNGDPDLTLTDRAEIVARVAAREDAETTAVADAVAALHRDRGHGEAVDAVAAVTHAAGLLEQFGSERPVVTPAEWAALLVGLRDVNVRDGCLGVWKDARGEAALALWCAATRIAPPGYVAAPATMAGIVAHAQGRGALAGEALERALRDDPDYRMAAYAMTALNQGVPPKQIRRSIIGATGTLRARGKPVLTSDGRVSTRPAAVPKQRRRRS